MINQEMFNYVYSVENFSQDKKKLILDIWSEVIKKHFLKEPESIEDVILDILGVIEISIDKTKKF